jgi:uncharacterized protein (DUF697 family)
MTNLPAFLPGAGTAAAIGADTLVLTTNQVVLVYKMAAIWGADLSNPRALLVEAAPVVGGAFLWRGAARTLIELLPGFAALAPKVGMAYVGTYVVGELANYYYRCGIRPSDARLREIEAEARAALAQAWHRLRPGQPADRPATDGAPRIVPVQAGNSPPPLPPAPAEPGTALPARGAAAALPPAATSAGPPSPPAAPIPPAVPPAPAPPASPSPSARGNPTGPA